jgi:hypothetical protein
MYCLGSPTAIIMKPIVSIVEEKRQENINRPIDQITAWRFYKPAKKNSKKNSRVRHTFMSYVMKCELEVAKLSDSEMINAKENLKYAEQMLFDTIYLTLTDKDTLLEE